MALTETTEYDRLEVVGTYKVVQIRKAIIIKRDGVEVPGSRSFERTSLECGTIDASDNFVDTDISGQPAEVQAVCNAVWTDAIKLAFKNYLISLKS